MNLANPVELAKGADSVAMPVPAAAGKTPDLPPAAVAAPPPMELPRLVMRGALAVVAFALLLALLLGLWRAREDMRDELAGALAQARINALLAAAQARSDDELLAALGSVGHEDGPRHLELRLLDAAGRVRLEPPPQPPAAWPVRLLVALNGVLFAPPADRTVSVALPRPGGAPWQAQWIASHDAEQREAMAQLQDMLMLVAGCGGVMLLVMRWHLKRSFRPLAPLLAAIARVEQQDVSAVRALPAMPIRELDAIANALRHLAGALERTEAQRRQLGAQVLTLQEDERSRIARELHDEFGQHLTALRVDAAWLQRRLADQPELAAVVAGMSQQCQRIQEEVRALLTRLRPLSGGPGDEQGSEDVERLRSLLTDLVQAWAQSPGQSTRYRLQFDVAGVAHDARLPRELVLAVYRISQEALTNVARHAQAGEALLRVHVQPVDGGGMLHWSVEDDGRGLDDPGVWQRGNGLAGIKERVWAAGGDLDCQPSRPGHASGPGLRLQALLRYATPRPPSSDPDVLP